MESLIEDIKREVANMESVNLGCYLANNSSSGGYADLWKNSPTNSDSSIQLKSSPNAIDHLCRSPNPVDFNMSGFSLSPIDFDPLPNLFSFGPCATSYKDFSPFKEKNPHDMADVLLSLKHAVVHPGQMTIGGAGGPLPPLSPAGSNFAGYSQSTGPNGPHSSVCGVNPSTGTPGATQVPPASVSFSVHPQAHQVMSPAHHHQCYPSMASYGHQYGDPSSASMVLPQTLGPLTNGNGSGAPHQNLVGPGGHHQTNLFPSMSVNVSMNMTMGMPGIATVPAAAYNVMEQLGPGPHSKAIPWGPGPGTTTPMTMGGSATSGPGASSCIQTSQHPASVPSSASVAFGHQMGHHQNMMAGPGLQMSYSTTNPTMSHHHPGYVGPGTPGSYSFTAEFRPSPCGEPHQCDKIASDIQQGFKNVTITHHTPGFKPVKPSASTYGFASSPCNTKKRTSTTSSSMMCHSRPPGLPVSLGASSGLVHNSMHCSDVTSGMNSYSDAISKINLCRICGKTYARPSTLKTHMRTHSGEKPYRCSTCNKSFSQAANLTAHIRTHSGEKPFRCPICDRRFSQSSSVTTHMRTHSGERPYRCRMCKKAFSDSSTLTKHLRIHSGEKPYQCKLCLLRFSQSGNLNRHMRVHTNPL